MAIRILVADDHHVVRHGLRKILDDEDDLVVTGEAGSGQQALDLLASGTEADVLLTDLSMPGMDGVQLAKEIRDQYPDLKIVLLTIQQEEAHIQRAFEAGIKSYVFKTALPHELLYAIRQVQEGRNHLCSGLSTQLMDRIGAWARNKQAASTDVDFSEREMDVLRLMAAGYTNEEAADKLFTSRRTVEGHRQAMIDKTGSKNSLALVAFAVRHGLLT